MGLRYNTLFAYLYILYHCRPTILRTQHDNLKVTYI